MHPAIDAGCRDIRISSPIRGTGSSARRDRSWASCTTRTRKPPGVPCATSIARSRAPRGREPLRGARPRDVLLGARDVLRGADRHAGAVRHTTERRREGTAVRGVDHVVRALRGVDATGTRRLRGIRGVLAADVRQCPGPTSLARASIRKPKHRLPAPYAWMDGPAWAILYPLLVDGSSWLVRGTLPARARELLEVEWSREDERRCEPSRSPSARGGTCRPGGCAGCHGLVRRSGCRGSHESAVPAGGKRAVTRQPPSPVGPASSVPPQSCTRSSHAADAMLSPGALQLRGSATRRPVLDGDDNRVLARRRP